MSSELSSTELSPDPSFPDTLPRRSLLIFCDSLKCWLVRIAFSSLTNLSLILLRTVIR